MNPVDDLVTCIERGDFSGSVAFAPDVVLEATVPNWHLTVRGRDGVLAQVSAWFAAPGHYEHLRRTPLPDGELVELVLRWQEDGQLFAASQAHVLEVRDGAIVSDRMWCGGRWSEQLVADIRAA